MYLRHLLTLLCRIVALPLPIVTEDGDTDLHASELAVA
jgi:hypothetical protein